MLKSSIDLGTNTCLLLIAEVSGTNVEPVGDYSTIVRLGQGVDQSRNLAPEAMERTLNCLETYAGRVRDAGLSPAETLCVATAQARDSRNGKDFFAQVQRETGFRFRTISGDEEAELSFRGGLLPGMDPGRSVIIDIGGGSTELVSSKGGESLNLGSVRFTERFLKSDPVTDDEFWACQDAIDTELEKLKPWREDLKDPELVGVAGTVTTLATWYLGLEKFDAAKIDGAPLTRGDIHRMVEDLKWRTVAERRELNGIEAGRADVLLAGAMILWRAMEVLQFRECKVSTRGLRYGLLLKSAPAGG